IVNVERSFAGPAEVRPGGRHFPFAKANQILTWQQESTEELLALFEEVYSGAVTEREFEPRTGMIVGEDGRSQRSSGRLCFVSFCSYPTGLRSRGSATPLRSSPPPPHSP